MSGFIDRLWNLANRVFGFELPANFMLWRHVWKVKHSPITRGRRLESQLNRLESDVVFLKRRLATFLGENIALTFLADETPILVNSNDYGGPMNLIVGGQYEQENLQVLLSYIKPNSVVLDIGANVGFFTLKLARRLCVPGRVHAFEPHPFLKELLSRNIHLNGLGNVATIHNFGLSDQNCVANFQYPPGHLGGGHFTTNATAGSGTIKSEVRKLDEVLPAGLKVDVVKIDVEGHELQVLRGMHRTICQSPSIAILLEKLAPHAGNECEIQSFLASLGLELYGVKQDTLLEPLSISAFEDWSGYVLAVRPAARGALNRSFFAIYPDQLRVHQRAVKHADGDSTILSSAGGTTLFFGPYWFLEKGLWTLNIDGKITGRITITIAERVGSKVHRLHFDRNTLERTFYVDHDLVHFECVARVRSARAELSLTRLVLTKLM